MSVVDCTTQVHTVNRTPWTGGSTHAATQYVPSRCSSSGDSAALFAPRSAGRLGAAPAGKRRCGDVACQLRCLTPRAKAGTAELGLRRSFICTSPVCIESSSSCKKAVDCAESCVVCLTVGCGLGSSFWADVATLSVSSSTLESANSSSSSISDGGGAPLVGGPLLSSLSDPSYMQSSGQN